ncbi:MAG TPA: SpoIID/LytB domain-containing protein [Actinomycetota bacterium]|nr:SpoIID/LytB domain-containing protein [Actinomycetota bacterium]
MKLRAAAALVLGGIVTTLAPPGPAAAAPATFVFKGLGWGHAVGLSQYGSLEQAKDGRSWKTILTTYYKGASIGTNDVPSAVRVLLAGAVPQVTVEASSRFSFTSGGTEVAASPGKDGRWIVRQQPAGRFTIYRPNGLPAGAAVSGPVKINYEPWSTILTVLETNARYRWGKLELAATGDKIRVIGDLPLERYLRGISEVPSSWPTEALRAQAVAARTYAADKARRAGHHRAGCDCTLYSSTADQVYRGYDKEDPAVSVNSRWVSAVDATAGQVVTYGGHAIQAYYSSSSGGRTEAAADVWSSDLPYLRPVDDPWSQRETNPYAHWTVKLAQEEVAARLGLRRVDSIEVKSKTGGGGIREAVVRGNETQTLRGTTLRSKLGLRSTKFTIGGSQEAIWSSWKRIQPNDAASGSPALAATSEGALHALVTSPTGVPYAARRGEGTSAAWTRWSRVGATKVEGTDPGITVTSSGAVQAILRDRSGAILTARMPPGGSWSNWVRLGSSTARGREPEIAAGPDGAVWAVILGQTSQSVYAARRDPQRGWSGWTKVGDDAYEPTIGGTAGGAVLAVRGANNAMKYSVHNGGWRALRQVGSGYGKSPSLVASAGRVVLAVRGRSADRVYVSTLERSGWTSWTQISSDLVASGAQPTVVVDRNLVYHVFIRGPGDVIYTASKGKGAWAGFFQVGDSGKAAPGTTIAPAAVRGRVYVLVRGPSKGLFTSYRAA